MFGKYPDDFQVIHYILRVEVVESYSPHFAVFGFRYVLLSNYPGEVKAENFTSVAIYSAMEETGDFNCSNSLVNQLVLNTKWSQKSYFMEIPTDCPTRERAGWTGDAQVFCRTATDLMNVYTFFEKWMQDVAAEQADNGIILSTVPNVMVYHNAKEYKRHLETTNDPLEKMKMNHTKPGEPGLMDGSAGWGDASVIIPWTMYLCYGDRKILEQQYDSAKAWVDYMDACAKDGNDAFKDTPAYNNYTE